MRVININAVYGRLSTGRTVEQLNEGLKKYGVVSTTVFSAGPKNPKAHRMGSPWDVRLHSLLARVFGNSGYYSHIPTLGLLRYLDREKPDIVHLHNLHSNFICLPMLFGYLAKNRIPAVVTLHDCWWFTGKCTHYTADGCTHRLTGCGHCPRLRKDIPSWLFDRSRRMLADKRKWFESLPAYAVIGVSDWITAEAKLSFMGSAKLVRRIYNWIDTELFSPTPSDIRSRYGLEGKYLILGVAGLWQNSKGLQDFIRLARELPPEMRIVLIGAMPEERDLGGIVSIPLTENQRELAEWYSAADVFLTLSREESFGKVSAEALSCGTPVIAVGTTANPELVGRGCGVVISDTSPSAVLDAIARVRSVGKDKMLPTCREFALKSFGMEDRISDTLAVYNELIKE